MARKSKALDKPATNAHAVNEPEAAYEPTPRERAAMAAYQERMADGAPWPRMKFNDKAGKLQLGPDHPDVGVATLMLMKSIGTDSVEFYSEFTSQLANAGTQGQGSDAKGLNFMLAVVGGIEPRDQLEAMLAAQMAAVHMASMTFARRLAHVDSIAQQDSAERAFNKLARTYAMQMEALKRYRSDGRQTVVVKRVTVKDGGQAIVGNVDRGGRGRPAEEQSTP